MELGGLVSLIIYLMVAGLIFWLLWWVIGYSGIPEPFAKVARVIIAVIAVIFLVGILLSFLGQPIGSIRLK
jgi:hypothetical protein